MTKWLLGLSCAFVLAIAASGGVEVEAKGKAKGKNKQCMATNLVGQPVTWRCKGSERCCYSVLLDLRQCQTGASCM